MTNAFDAPAPGGAEDHPEGRIVFKDNRKIDAATGKARASAAGKGSGGPAPDGPGGSTGSAGSDAAGDAVADARQEAAERTADLQRLSAEYANYRKRVERDKQAATAAGKAAVMAELLAVCDDLERAEEHGDLTGGFKTVADKFTGTLARLGLEHYGAEGDAFDPNLHEAVQFSESAEVAAPTVAAVLRRGYLLGERVLRAAVVAVAGPAGGDAADGGPDGGDADGAGTAGAGDADTAGGADSTEGAGQGPDAGA